MVQPDGEQAASVRYQLPVCVCRALCTGEGASLIQQVGIDKKSRDCLRAAVCKVTGAAFLC